MAEAKKNAAVEAAAAEPDRVDIHIPRGAANDDPNFFVSVNGVSYLLPKGKTSSVPRAVAAEIKRSWAAQEALDERIDALKSE